MSAEVLRPACELAFAVAREGVESADPVEPPAAMRSFLYVDDLPRRAIAAAQQAIEESSDFRHRVASKADEDGVGRAGYLWLHRPTGWAVEFENLAIGDDDDGDDPQTIDPQLEAVYRGLTSEPIEPIELINAQPPEPDPPEELRPVASADTADTADGPMATVSPIGAPNLDIALPVETTFPSSASLGLAAVTNTEQAEELDGPSGFDGGAVGQDLADADGGFEAADALESELDSLRGLVARLANERDTDSAPPEPLLATADADGVEREVVNASPSPLVDAEGLQSDLETAHHELYLAQADLTIARQEREEAQRLQSEALKRQVQLEKELATVREQKADLEGELGSAQAKAISVEERFTRSENQLTELDREREAVRAQLETMTLERNQIRDERAALKVERDELRSRVDEVAEKTGGVDIVELVQAHRTATADLENTSRELARMIGQSQQYEAQLSAVTEDATSLKSERIDLRARLGETETALEVTTTQFDALKIDAERMAAELGALRAERDGMQSQLAELQTGLAEVLDEAAESRQRNDADRRALNEIRVEHDVVTSRLQDVEQAEADARAKAETLTVERDNLLTGRDELLEERGQLRGELATAAAERGAAQQQLDETLERNRALETELQMERRQREELANRLLELDDLAERTAAEQQALLEERDGLGATVGRLEAELAAAAEIRVERDQLAAELVGTRRTAEETRSALEAQIEETRSGLEGQVQEVRQEADQLGLARSELESQLAESQEQAAALRALLAEVEQERNQAQADGQQASSEIDGLRTTLSSRDDEVESLRSELLGARRQAEEAAVALQVKEGELRTVLGARSNDAAELDRLRADVAAATAQVEQAEANASAFMAPAAEVESRDQELAATRNELEEANAELDQLRNELAAARVELASTTAELEARTSGEAIAAAPADVDELDLDGGADELDSMAAEVRSALRGPSMLDDIAEGSSGQPSPELDELDDVAVAAASDTGFAPPADTDNGAGADGSDPVVEFDRVPPMPPADITGSMPSLADLPLEHDAGLVDDRSDGPVPVDEPQAPAAEPAAAMAQHSVAPAALDDDDELDAVSELIAQTVSGFAPGQVPEVGSFGDDQLDLTAELTRIPDDPSAIDGADSVGVGSPPPSILGDAPESFRPAEQPDLSVRRAGGSKRRRIDVPGDIVDDEVAVARYVVSSPDVVLLVDGDSVAELGWPSLPVAQRRDALVTYLADLSASSGAAPDVVFDGRLGDDDSLPASRAVRIRLSTPPTPPGAALDELVDAYPEQWPIALVTDDVELATTAGDRGAAVLNNGQLLDLFIAE